MAPILVFAAAASAQLPHGDGWLVFSRSPMLERSKTTVELGTLSFDFKRPFPERYEYWLRRTVETSGKEPQITWASSVNCEAVRPALMELRKLPIPHFAPIGTPGRGGRSMIDGTSYSLSSISENGFISMSSSVDANLSAWVERTLHGLEPCWTTDPPIDPDG